MNTWTYYWCDVCQLWVEAQSCHYCGNVCCYTAPDDEEGEDAL